MAENFLSEVSANVLLARHRRRSGEQGHAELLASLERGTQAALRSAGAEHRLDPDLEVLHQQVAMELSALLDNAGLTPTIRQSR